LDLIALRSFCFAFRRRRPRRDMPRSYLKPSAGPGIGAPSIGPIRLARVVSE
jgi:hypothetical protein